MGSELGSTPCWLRQSSYAASAVSALVGGDALAVGAAPAPAFEAPPPQAAKSAADKSPEAAKSLRMTTNRVREDSEKSSHAMVVGEGKRLPKPS